MKEYDKNVTKAIRGSPVLHLPHHIKVKGLSPASAADNGREKNPIEKAL